MAELRAIFADVGQGDCTLIQLPDGRFMLVDIFRSQDSGIDVFKLLDDKLPEGPSGKRKLDFLVVTHAHDDHITGIGDLYERYDVEWLWVPQYETKKKLATNFDAYKKIVEKHPKRKLKRPQGSRSPLNEKDSDYDLGKGVTVRAFSPPGYINIDEKLSEKDARKVVHEHCLVLHLTYKSRSILLTGDSDLACWKRIEGYYPDEVEASVFAANVLHASHHGSRTFVKNDKDDKPWLQALEAIDPGWIVVSVGDDNDHDHPHPDMMKIYRNQVDAKKDVLQTNQSGTIEAVIDGKGNVSVSADTGDYASAYKWDDDDNGGGGGGKPSGGKGGTGGRRRQSPNRLDNTESA